MKIERVAHYTLTTRRKYLGKFVFVVIIIVTIVIVTIIIIIYVFYKYQVQSIPGTSPSTWKKIGSGGGVCVLYG